MASDDREGSYWARVERFAEMMDPRLLLVDEDAVKQARAVLAAAEEPSAETVAIAGAVASESWAQKIIHSAVHPDTGELVWPPFLRLGWIVPANMLFDAGLILARGSTQLVLANTANQAYNAAHYWANRNASNDNAATSVALSFAAAATSSVTAALALERWMLRLPASSLLFGLLRRCAPFLAVAAADLLNLPIIRHTEFMDGIEVTDPETGEVLGTSKRAGALAVSSCVSCRILAAAPVLLTSTTLHHALAKVTWLKPRPVVRTGILLLAVGSAIQAAVPLTFGLFRRHARVEAGWLEPHIREAVGGDKQRLVEYHRGI